MWRSLNITPFIGVGLGWARNQAGVETFQLSDHRKIVSRDSAVKNQLAWDVVVGSSAAIYRQLDVLSFVSFSSLGRSNFGSSGGTLAQSRSLYSLDVGLGFRYNFI